MPTFTTRRPLALLLITLVALAAWRGTARAQDGFYLKDGDRVVFYGDSITDQRLYTTYVENYVVTRLPQLHVTFTHSGWGGDKVTGGGGGQIDQRLQRDVIAYKPTVVTVMLGMNDGRYQPFDQGYYDIYTSGLEHIVQTLRAALPGVRITLIEPSPYDDVTRPPQFAAGYNAVLARYGDFIKQMAQREGLQVADLNGPVVANLAQAYTANAPLAAHLLPDRVHPSPGAHWLLAAALLAAWHAPATVTAVTIDAATAKVVRAANTTVAAVQPLGDAAIAGGGLTWTQTDAALPLPVNTADPLTALVMKTSDVVATLDQEPLQVTGLTAANYTLKIDGSVVGTFSRDDLAAGVNLALLPTPMLHQAQAVNEWTVQHNDLHYVRWRQYQTSSLYADLPSLQRALDGFDALEGDLVARQHAAAQPVARHYELLPATPPPPAATPPANPAPATGTAPAAPAPIAVGAK